MKRCLRCGCQNDERFVKCGMCGEELTPVGGQRLLVRCLCGETYYAADFQVGRRIRCAACERILVVEQPGGRPSGRPTLAAAEPAKTSPRPVGGRSRSRVAIYALVGLVAVLWAASASRHKPPYVPPTPLPAIEPNVPKPSPMVWNPPPEAPLPANGDGVFYFNRAGQASRLEIVPRSAQGHIVVKVEGWTRPELMCWFFIREGQSAATPIPSGSYRLKFACGRTWYGEKDLFGPAGTYSKVTSEIHIPPRTAYTIDLSPSREGTLREEKLREGDF
jgi:hypothetical protein